MVDMEDIRKKRTLIAIGDTIKELESSTQRRPLQSFDIELDLSDLKGNVYFQVSDS